MNGINELWAFLLIYFIGIVFGWFLRKTLMIDNPKNNKKDGDSDD